VSISDRSAAPAFASGAIVSLRTPVLLIAGIGGALLVLILVLASQMLNQREIERSQTSIQSFIEVRLEIIRRGLIDFVQWENGGAAALIEQRDPAWADRALGDHFSRYYDATTVLVFTADGEILYGWENDRRIDRFEIDRFGPSFQSMLRAVQNREERTLVSMLALAGEGVHLVGLAAVTRDGFADADGPEAFLVVSRRADSALISQRAEDRGLRNLTVVAEESALRDDSYPLRDLGGAIVGWYTWDLDLPGRDLLRRVLPLVLACELGVLILLAVFLRRAATATAHLAAGREEIARQREEIAAREETLRAILRYAGDGVLTLDEAGRITSANIAAGLIFGAETAALENRLLSELLQEPQGLRWLDLASEGAAADSGVYRCPLLRADGRADEVELRLSRIPRNGGSVVLALVRDVAEQRRAEETLNLLSSAMIVVAPDGRVLLTNRSAEALLARSDSLSVRNGKLVAPLDASAVELALAAAVRPGAKPIVLKLRRSGAMTPMTALVTPLDDEGDRSRPIRNCVVFLRDPDVRMSVSEPLLRDMYGLTPAEARVVASLVSGRSLQEVAVELEISLNTVRNHLKQAYRKTHTSRQSELVTLVLSGPAFRTEMPGAPEAAA
jgi:PAS domain S-box-containing protein